jgi:negative regulator of flagellin synthesis FlgM
MHVYGPTQVHGPQPLNAPHVNRVGSAQTPPASAMPGDEVQISSVGQLLGRLADIPDVRAGRVAELRAAILEGRYESEDKLSLALDKLLEEIG